MATDSRVEALGDDDRPLQPEEAALVRRLKHLATALADEARRCDVCDGIPAARQNWGAIVQRSEGGIRELVAVMVHFRDGLFCHVHDGKPLQFAGAFPADAAAAAVRAYATGRGWRVVEVCGPAAVSFLLLAATPAARGVGRAARRGDAEQRGDAAEIERWIAAKHYSLRDVVLAVVDMAVRRMSDMANEDVPLWVWECAAQAVRCCDGEDHVFAAAAASSLRANIASWCGSGAVGASSSRLRVADALEDALDCFSQVAWCGLAARAISELGDVEALDAAVETRRILGARADRRYPGGEVGDE